MNAGTLVISLDFELAWGVRDVLSMEEYGANIRGVHTAVPRLLELFSKYDIHATFATVGFILLRNKKELCDHFPKMFPQYSNSELSPYTSYISTLPDASESDPLHFAPLLVDAIKKTKGMELGTHTFSHYYCMEAGQSVEEFSADLDAALEVSRLHRLEVKSLVFPRNQFRKEYLDVCRQHGIISFRGNEKSWLHPGDHSGNANAVRRFFRLLDAYINISGHHCYDAKTLIEDGMCNIPSSRFLRPHYPKLKWLDLLKLKRITNAMTYAARNKRVYHLWWHPHNFGIHQEDNFSFIKKILDHYSKLKNEFGFRSMNMQELSSDMLSNGKN